MPNSQPLPGGFYDPQWPMQGPPPFDPSIPFDQFGQPIPVDQFGQPYATGGFNPVPAISQPLPQPTPQAVSQPLPAPSRSTSQPSQPLRPQSQQTASSPRPQTSSQNTQSLPSPATPAQPKQTTGGAPMRPASSYPADTRVVQRRAGMPFELGIASLVFGIVACLTAWAPAIGQYGLIVGAAGAIMALIGLITALASKGRGVILSVAGALLCAMSIVLFFQMDAKYNELSESLNNLSSSMQNLNPFASLGNTEANTSANTSNTSNTSASNSGAPATHVDGEFADLATGATATLPSGLSVSIEKVQTDLANFDNTPVTCATITYHNNGENPQAYNMLDWLSETADGSQSAATFYSEAENELGAGTLVPGGTLTANVYFDGTAAKIIFQPMTESDSPLASWLV